MTHVFKESMNLVDGEKKKLKRDKHRTAENGWEALLINWGGNDGGLDQCGSAVRIKSDGIHDSF